LPPKLNQRKELNRKIRVGAVSYLNTKPLIYGFEQGRMKDEVELIIDYPSKIAAALLNNEIDIGLVPIAVIPEMKEHHIISDYGIAADGEVASVCLFSEVPLNEIKTVLLDYQSRTSVALVKVLMKEFWKINPVFEHTEGDFRNKIQGSVAAVVIGDRALEQRTQSAYIYDLGEAWKQFTGLPFVFAAWVSNKLIEPAFVKAFNETNAVGLEHLDIVINAHQTGLFDLQAYYTKHIKFMLNPSMHEAITLFLSKLKEPEEQSN
jgi:chorismate dehydratase